MSILIPRRGNWPTLPQMAAPVRTEFAGDTWAPWSSGLYTDSANITIKANALGLAWDNADTAGYITLPAKTYQVSDGFTLVFVCEVRNQNLAHAMPFGDAAHHSDFLWHESGSFRLRCNTVDFLWAAQSGALATYAIVVTPAGKASLYRDGKFVGTVSGSGTSFKLASIGRGFYTYPTFDGQVNLVHVIPRAISLDVAQKLSENAANLFAPLRQDRYFPAGAATHTATYNDAATPADASSAALVAVAALAESATPGAASVASLVTTAAYQDAGTPTDIAAAVLVTSASYAESSASADDVYTAVLVAGGASDYTDASTPIDSVSATLITATTWADTAVPADDVTASLVSSHDYEETGTTLDSYSASLVSSGSGSLTQQDIDAIADAVWNHPKALTVAKFLGLK